MLQISPSVEPQALPGVAFHGIIPVSAYKVNKVNRKCININVISHRVSDENKTLTELSRIMTLLCSVEQHNFAHI